MSTRKCTRCKVEKPESMFVRYGLIVCTICKDCRDKRSEYIKNSKKGIKSPRLLLAERRKEAISKGNFICSTCKIEQPFSEFRTTSAPIKCISTSYTCNSCLQPRNKSSKIKKYGLNIESLTKLFEYQDGKCAICKTNLSLIISKDLSKSTLCIDHDHITGKVRGLLCNNCNRGLGLFRDNENILLSAHNYLLVHNKQDELSGKPCEGNQQPSLDSNIFEGSTTNSQIPPSNVEDGNADTSVLP